MEIKFSELLYDDWEKAKDIYIEKFINNTDVTNLCIDYKNYFNNMYDFLCDDLEKLTYLAMVFVDTADFKSEYNKVSYLIRKFLKKQ